MTSISRRPVRIAGLTALAVALLAVPATVVAPTVAATAAPACADHSADSARAIPGVSARTDSSDLGALERARTAVEARRVVSAKSARTAAVSLAPNVLIPVYVHVIKGKHAGESRVSRQKVRRVMSILRGAYSGSQSSYGYNTRFTFTLKRMDFTKNDAWYHARMNSPADVAMKRKLHRGGPRTLNLYINAPGGAEGLLGYARFPWQYKNRPLLDGVTVHVDTLPGGRFTSFNLGDTVPHEVGHWLGLFHTFQSRTGDGCDPLNDAVADTPAEIEPNGRRPSVCDNPGNLCNVNDVLLGGLRDPVFNFMDYASDRCMREFTKGQSDRMDVEFAMYRR